MKVLRGAMKLEDRTEVWGKLPLLLPFHELDSYLLFMGSKVLTLVPTVSALNIQGQPEDRMQVRPSILPHQFTQNRPILKLSCKASVADFLQSLLPAYDSDCDSQFPDLYLWPRNREY